MKGGIADLVKHKWFGSFDWKGLRKGTIPAPSVPDLNIKQQSGGGQCEEDGADELVVSSSGQYIVYCSLLLYIRCTVILFSILYAILLF